MASAAPWVPLSPLCNGARTSGRRPWGKRIRIPSSEEALAFCSPCQCATTRDRPSQPELAGQPSVIIIMSADLIKAAKAGDVAEARRCLDAGADGKRNEALMEAARCGHAQVAALLIERGANASYGSKKCDFQTPLIQAALENQLEVVELLIDKGANVNANDNDFRTALMYAAKEGHVDVVKALLKAEPDLTLSDNDDLTAPMLAQLFDQDAVVEIFKAAGVTQFEKEDSDDY